MQIPQHLKTRRLRRGNLGSIEQIEFTDLIVAFVFAFDGGARRQKVIDLIHETFREQFKKPDYELLHSQKPPKERWIHHIDWAKRKLVQEGFLLKPLEAPYGTWVLTEKGKRSAEILWKGSGNCRKKRDRLILPRKTDTQLGAGVIGTGSWGCIFTFDF